MNKRLKMRFGKYKGYYASDVPDDYANWCIKNNIVKSKLLEYFKTRLNYPKDRYKISVKDSVNNMDNDHIVLAYSVNHAIRVIKRKAKTTQSYHGTLIGAIKI